MTIKIWHCGIPVKFDRLKYSVWHYTCCISDTLISVKTVLHTCTMPSKIRYINSVVVDKCFFVSSQVLYSHGSKPK